MAIAKIDDLKDRIRDALRSDDFQKSAAGLQGTGLTAAVAGQLKRRNIGVTLVSVGPAAQAALADFAAVWKIAGTGKVETNWFSLNGAKR